jgi:hypothetical protein
LQIGVRVMQLQRRVYIAMFLVQMLPSTFATAVELANPSFEIIELTSGSYPSTVGDWNGNLSAIVSAENGIVPFAGNRMLKFLGTLSSGGGASIGSTVVQLVSGPDISPGATVIASAWFNRVAGSSPPVDTRFDVLIRAHSGTPAFYSLNNFIAETRSIFQSDNDPSTWELVTATLTLPAGTTYLAVTVNAVEDVLNNNELPEFHGHYVDGVAIVVPEPATLSLFCIGALILLLNRGRLHACSVLSRQNI